MRAPFGRDITGPAFDVKGYRTRHFHPGTFLLSGVPSCASLTPSPQSRTMPLCRCTQTHVMIAVGNSSRAGSPKAMLELPVVQPSGASCTVAVLKEPVLMLNMASSPIALFWSPVLLRSALRPCALLKVPLTLLNSAKAHTALLSSPSTLLSSAPAPSPCFGFCH